MGRYDAERYDEIHVIICQQPVIDSFYTFHSPFAGSEFRRLGKNDINLSRHKTFDLFLYRGEVKCMYPGRTVKYNSDVHRLHVEFERFLRFCLGAAGYREEYRQEDGNDSGNRSQFAAFLCITFFHHTGYFFIDDWNDHQGKEHRTGKSPDKGPCQSVLPFGAGTGSSCDRKHPEDHREGGHENRADTHLACIDQSIVYRFAFGPSFIGTVYDKDGILRNQSYHHDDAQDGKYIDRVMGERQRQDSPDKGYRDGEQHDKGINKGVVKDHHDEIYEDHCSDEGYEKTYEGSHHLFLVSAEADHGAPGFIIAKPGRECLDYRTRRGAVGICAHGGQGVAVLALQLRGPRGLVDVRELLKFNDLVLAVDKRKMCNVVGIRPVEFVERHPDVKLV